MTDSIQIVQICYPNSRSEFVIQVIGYFVRNSGNFQAVLALIILRLNEVP